MMLNNIDYGTLSFVSELLAQARRRATVVRAAAKAKYKCKMDRPLDEARQQHPND